MTELTDNLLQLFCVYILRMLLLHFGNTKQKAANRLLVLLFYLSFGMGLAYWDTVPYIVRHFSACVLCFGTELDGIVYFFLLYVFMQMYRKKNIKIKRYFGFYRCFLWVLVFSFVCEAVILRTS